MAAGAEPLLVKNMLDIVRPLIYGGTLLGAGGGGFLVLFTKHEDAIEEIRGALSGLEAARGVTFHSVQVDTVGMELNYESL